jgi:hypothetical protein
MSPDRFKASLHHENPPVDLDFPLLALWYDAKGNWEAAHDLVDGPPDRLSARIHAYLHRKEGDIWNADYWYNKAGEKRPDLELDEEWSILVERICRM